MSLVLGEKNKRLNYNYYAEPSYYFCLSSMEDNTEFKIGYYPDFNSKSLVNAELHSQSISYEKIFV